MTESIHTDIWKQRSEKYNKIAWVTNQGLLKFIFQSSLIEKGQKVLEAGIGTGILSKFILKNSPDVKIHGLDSSSDMINYINDERILARVGDLKNMPFMDNSFDRVIFRNVLHHCVGYTSSAIDEAMRVLKPGGKIIICEGVPINDECVSDFSQIVTMKENRLVFTTENFIQMLFKFKNKSAGSIILKQQSIINWINNCIEDDLLKAEILNKHYRTSDVYKKAANMTVKGDDILVDMKFLAVRAEK